MIDKRRVIFTTFAGRKECMSLLLRYVRYLMACGLVDDFHAWNFTRDPADERWLREEFKDAAWKPVAVLYGPTYHRLRDCTLRVGDHVVLRCKTPHDAHILVNTDAGDDVAEIVLGGWDNTRSAWRTVRQGREIGTIDHKVDPDEWTHVRLHVQDATTLHVTIGEHPPIHVPIRSRMTGLHVNVAAWHDTTCQWERACARTNERLMHVNNKRSWREYYAHYTEARYPNSIVIKCDDDIVFIDPAGFYRFVNQVATNMGDHTLAFPSIINNGVCAHHWQKAGLLPETVFGALPYDTFEGRLWGDGVLCGKLHQYFVENRERLIDEAIDLPAIRLPSGHRISINFFAIRSEDFAVLNTCDADDEHHLTVVLTRSGERKHLIVQSAVVAHLGFYRQRQTGLDEASCIRTYRELANRMLPS
jgi:hypothetical protein